MIVAAGKLCRFEWAKANGSFAGALPGSKERIRHPFPAVPTGDGKFLILEDTALYDSLCRSGLTCFPVQICRAESVELTSPRLALSGFSHAELRWLADKYHGRLLIGSPGRLPSPDCVRGTVEFPDRPPLALDVPQPNGSGCPAPLSALFETILSKGQYRPAVDCHVRCRTPLKRSTASAWLTPPRFSLKDLLSAAATKRFFPPDVIKARTSYRVLNIDFPLSVLASDSPVEEKEAFLHDLILYREQTSRTLYFEGPVYLLNR